MYVTLSVMHFSLSVTGLSSSKFLVDHTQLDTGELPLEVFKMCSKYLGFGFK